MLAGVQDTIREKLPSDVGFAPVAVEGAEPGVQGSTEIRVERGLGLCSLVCPSEGAAAEEDVLAVQSFVGWAGGQQRSLLRRRAEDITGREWFLTNTSQTLTQPDDEKAQNPALSAGNRTWTFSRHRSFETSSLLTALSGNAS